MGHQSGSWWVPLSKVGLAGRAGCSELGAPHIAAHGAQAPMPCVAHDLLIWHTVPIGCGDEAGGPHPCGVTGSRRVPLIPAAAARRVRICRTASGWRRRVPTVSHCVTRLPRDNQGECRIASSSNAPERAKHCLIRMLPSPHHFVNRRPVGLGLRLHRFRVRGRALGMQENDPVPAGHRAASPGAVIGVPACTARLI
jgi:hypothetical protein